MTHNIPKEQYIKDPCETCSTAFWKNNFFLKPDHIKIVKEKDISNFSGNYSEISSYFKLIHNLKEISHLNLKKEYYFQCVDIEKQKDIVVHLINRCYEDIRVSLEDVEKWTNYKVFDNELWLFIYETSSKYPIALGIADYDDEIGEGSLEWIQVLPEKRHFGLGKALINELLKRLKKKAKFVTVSGKINNKTKPELLYRKCGFEGNSIWYVLTMTKKS